ncbi:hypothetical protein VB776_08505 [Arcicella sp. DC2W]|uniref:Uncharacterized protein n=1 Tax=Arcicella gelida TaxID=2984195 RepID=A0ABU5S3B1_9BACT|nr:hypothetical protein [Arcicella sp. DC2W]MEA5402952.1 hypothetical protein [Arcicella sp. DC2W]
MLGVIMVAAGGEPLYCRIAPKILRQQKGYPRVYKTCYTPSK